MLTSTQNPDTLRPLREMFGWFFGCFQEMGRRQKVRQKRHLFLRIWPIPLNVAGWEQLSARTAQGGTFGITCLIVATAAFFGFLGLFLLCRFRAFVAILHIHFHAGHVRLHRGFLHLGMRFHHWAWHPFCRRQNGGSGEDKTQRDKGAYETLQHHDDHFSKLSLIFHLLLR